MTRRNLLAWLAVGLVLLLSACAARPQDGQAERRLIIISAFSPEMAKLKSHAVIESTRIINGRTFYLAHLSGKAAVLALSGVSMVNAAMTAQSALDNFPASGIVFSGIAGGVNPGLSIGDVVVPARWGQYQDQVFARKTAQGWNTGSFKSEYGHFGMMFPQKVSVTRRDGKPDSVEQIFWFPASPDMLAVAQGVAGRIQLMRRTQKGVELAKQPCIVVGGNGVSGPTFVDNAAYRDWVWSTFKADALDMETAAVAHVAYVNRVPFIAFRSLSDLAGGGPGENEVNTFLDLASDNAAAVVLTFLELLPAPAGIN
jgi:adenosylhomocysteine nucleosidase